LVILKDTKLLVKLVCDVGGLESSSKPLALQGAVTIQRHLRGFLVRIAIRRHRAAVVIQVGVRYVCNTWRYEDDDLCNILVTLGWMMG